MPQKNFFGVCVFSSSSSSSSLSPIEHLSHGRERTFSFSSINTLRHAFEVFFLEEGEGTAVAMLWIAGLLARDFSPPGYLWSRRTIVMIRLGGIVAGLDEGGWREGKSFENDGVVMK